MNQSVERQQNLLISVLVGELTISDVDELYEQFDKIVRQLNAENLKNLLIVDCSKLEKIDVEALSHIKKIMSGIKMFRTAIVGGSKSIRTIMGLVMKILGTFEEAKFFDTMDEAKAWIESQS